MVTASEWAHLRNNLDNPMIWGMIREMIWVSIYQCCHLVYSGETMILIVATLQACGATKWKYSSNFYKFTGNKQLWAESDKETQGYTGKETDIRAADRHNFIFDSHKLIFNV